MNGSFCHSRRRGSALLIVLGMLSFMLFSGLAFSVYMRETRLPSSFLRRSASTRQLAKAALAMAVTELDSAIGDNPHPGVGVNLRTGGLCNTWDHRVFFGVTNVSDSAAESETVSTLTLEGLAYLPPCLINEARYYSRRTPTASWRKFAFDAGRFAYCAIDVSDYFDVNRIRADLPRSSAAGSRISFSHLFEKKAHQLAADEGALTDWEDMFTQKGARKYTENDAISFQGCVPFVSLADLNLAIGTDTFGPLASGFCQYVKNAAGGRGTANQGFYPVLSGDTEESYAGYRSMTFVTDSWYPRTAEELMDRDLELSLADRNVQPFPMSITKEDADMSLSSIFTAVTGLNANRVHQFLPIVGLLALYDYLDEDSVPLSLAIPTQEKTPMICAINMKMLMSSLKVESAVADNPGAESGNTRTMKRTYTYHLNGAQLLGPALGVKALVLYPFRHQDGEAPGNYDVDGVAKIFLSRAGQDNDVPLVGAEGPDGLNLGNDSQMTERVADGVVTVPFSGGSVVVSDSSATELDQAVLDSLHETSAMTVKFGSSSYDLFNNNNLLKVTRTWTQTKDKSGNWSPVDPNWDDLADVTEDAVECDVPFLRRDGSVSGKADWLEVMKSGEKLKLNVAVWVRLKKDGKVVDLAPSSFKDDAAQKGTAANAPLAKVISDKVGAGSYLLKVPLAPDGADLYNCGLVSLNPRELNEMAKNNTSTPLKLQQETLAVVDPRYNHDPESWISIDGSAGTLKTDWRDVAQPVYGSRDGDPFMAVSNQGYLQSIYELAHLPRMAIGRIADCEAHPLGDVQNGIYKGNADGTGNVTTGDLEPSNGRKVIAQGWNNGNGVRNSRLMWRTYDSYARGQNGGVDDFEGLQLTAGDSGVKVCPYGPTSDVEPLMAAFANTPHGWFAASTNENQNINPAMACSSAAEFNEHYAWNEYSSSPGGRLGWEDLRNIALVFRQRMIQDNGTRDWIDVYNDMWDNGGGGNTLMGVSLDSGKSDPLFSPDRKFLHGFWRECFAVRQQLFLIFVRAEPMMMGGGVAGIAPPQLGARAVALVWRDPTRYTSGSGGNNDKYPHRTRVLFYHPLD